MNPNKLPVILVDTKALTCHLAGDWTIASLAQRGQVATRQKQLKHLSRVTHWDLSAITQIDAVGVYLLWKVWGQTLPASIQISPSMLSLFDDLDAVVEPPIDNKQGALINFVQGVGLMLIGFVTYLKDLLRLAGQFILDAAYFIRHPNQIPIREISAQIYHVGAKALGITALVGFLIGVVLSFLTAQQLRMFGADVLIVNLLGIAILRELGPLLAAILVAGRSGSSMTAQIGVMRLTQELDAMEVMGVAHGKRLVFPRVFALCFTLPLLVIWTNAMALLGGAAAAWGQLGLSPTFFFTQLPKVVAPANYWFGISKGVAFGLVIAMIACLYGLKIKPNTQSLGQGTTASVVTSITVVILVDAVFAILFRSVGI